MTALGIMVLWVTVTAVAFGVAIAASPTPLQELAYLAPAIVFFLGVPCFMLALIVVFIWVAGNEGR